MSGSHPRQGCARQRLPASLDVTREGDAAVADDQFLERGVVGAVPYLQDRDQAAQPCLLVNEAQGKQVLDSAGDLGFRGLDVLRAGLVDQQARKSTVQPAKAACLCNSAMKDVTSRALPDVPLRDDTTVAAGSASP
jgi:hypothetical protein